MGKLIMILILALGVAMAVPKSRAMMVEKAQPVINHFKAKLVPSRLKTMADELAVRVNRGEGYPSGWSSWLEKDYTSDPKDPWGHEYYLKKNRDSFTVGSMGPDGIQGTEDDFKLERKLGKP